MGTTVTGRRRNRSWPEALKREIVAASFAPGSSVSTVARHYDVNANQVFSWRRLYRDDPRVSGVPSAPQLIPVVVTAEQDAVAPGRALSPRWLHRHQPVATGRAGRRLLQQARDVRALDQGRQGRDKVDAAVMLLVRRQCCPAATSCAGLQSRQLHADAG